MREHVVRLRSYGYSDSDIKKALDSVDINVSLSLIDKIIDEERKHFSKLVNLFDC